MTASHAAAVDERQSVIRPQPETDPADKRVNSHGRDSPSRTLRRWDHRSGRGRAQGVVRFAQGSSARQSNTASPDMNTQRKRAQLIASCVILSIVSIPLILRVVPPNGVYGFRVSATRSPAIWYPANAFMGWALLVAAVMSATVLMRLPEGVKRWLPRTRASGYSDRGRRRRSACSSSWPSVRRSHCT